MRFSLSNLPANRRDNSSLDLEKYRDVLSNYMEEKGIKDGNAVLREPAEKEFRYWSLEKV